MVQSIHRRRNTIRSSAMAGVAALVTIGGMVWPASAQDARQATAPQGAITPSDVIGVWIDHKGRGAIEIVPCGTRVCGYIYWVKETVAKGKPVLDINNPDPKRRNQPICGTRILANLTQGSATRLGHVWTGGEIYNPEEGEKFDAEIKLTSANELSVLGYLGMKFMGETFAWKRAPADLARCGPPRV